MFSNRLRPACARAAFTLVEMTIVLVIISVMVSFIAPSVVRGVRAGETRSVATKVCDLLHYARACAVTRKRPVEVLLVQEKRICRVVLNTPALPWIEEEQAESRLLTAMAWPEGVELALVDMSEEGDDASVVEEENRLVFHSDGHAADVAIQVSRENEDSIGIEVVGATGQARFIEEPL